MKLFIYKYTTMPRLSLYRPEKGNDFKFIDRAINQQFQIGGTDIFVHKYAGTVAPEGDAITPTTPANTNPIPELGIQDVLLMENRDRNYEPDIYNIRGIYTMQDIDFNLAQFGFFLSNDNIMITFHLKDCIDKLGRKIMSGDVLELPHLKDEYAMDQSNVALKRFYVVTDVSRAATGFSQTWYPHLLRAKCEPIVDSQEYSQIFNQDAGNGDGSTLADLMSTYNQSIAINNAVLAQAELDAPLSGFDTSQMYVIPQNSADGTVDREDASMTDVNVSTSYLDASVVLKSPTEDKYAMFYLSESGIPPNGAPYTFGIEFPVNPVDGQFHLRTDFLPNRLFRYNNGSSTWIKYEDNIRMTLSNSYSSTATTFDSQDPTQIQNIVNTRQSQKAGFINNNSTSTIAGQVVSERQSLSKALKPKADN
jgi:hypothetical protein